MPRPTRKEWLTEREAAEVLGVRPSLLSTWRKSGLVPVRPNPDRRGVLYPAQEVQRIKQLADRLAQLGVPSPVSVIVRGRLPVRWVAELLGVSRQRIYQLVPGPLTWENTLSLLERRVQQNPNLKPIYQGLKRLYASLAARGQPVAAKPARRPKAPAKVAARSGRR